MLAGAAAHGTSQLLQGLHCPLTHPGTAAQNIRRTRLARREGRSALMYTHDQLADTFDMYLLVLEEALRRHPPDVACRMLEDLPQAIAHALPASSQPQHAQELQSPQPRPALVLWLLRLPVLSLPLPQRSPALLLPQQRPQRRPLAWAPCLLLLLQPLHQMLPELLSPKQPEAQRVLAWRASDAHSPAALRPQEERWGRCWLQLQHMQQVIHCRNCNARKPLRQHQSYMLRGAVCGHMHC